MRELTDPNQSVVVTGVGCISSLGSLPEIICRDLYRGRHGFSSRKFSSPDCNKSRSWRAGWLRQEPTVLGASARFASRGASMACAASLAALKQAKLNISPALRRRVAIVLGTCYGSINSVHAFDADACRNGNRYANPTLFPNTVINAPAGYAGASLGVQGPNMTISTGLSSGFTAMAIGRELLLRGEADVVLAGGYDELSPLILSILKGERVPPRSARGTYMKNSRNRHPDIWMSGEGATIFVLESARRVQRRRAPIQAIIHDIIRCAPIDDLRKSMSQPLVTSLRNRHHINDESFILFSGANGSSEISDLELSLLESLPEPPFAVTAPKSLLGEMGGGSVMLLATAIWSLRRGLVPPTLQFTNPDSFTSSFTKANVIAHRSSTAVVTSLDPQGEWVGVVVRKPVVGL